MSGKSIVTVKPSLIYTLVVGPTCPQAKREGSGDKARPVCTYLVMGFRDVNSII